MCVCLEMPKNGGGNGVPEGKWERNIQRQK